MNSYSKATTEEEYRMNVWEMIVDDLSLYPDEHFMLRTTKETHPCDKLITIASRTLAKNQETFVAKWILQNPDKNLSNYTLYHKPSYTCQGYNEFWVGEKNDRQT